VKLCPRITQLNTQYHLLVRQFSDDTLTAVIVSDRGLGPYLSRRLPDYGALAQQVPQMLTDNPEISSDVMADALDQPAIVIRHIRGEPTTQSEPFTL
jgi:hypothetical protein